MTASQNVGTGQTVYTSIRGYRTHLTAIYHLTMVEYKLCTLPPLLLPNLKNKTQGLPPVYTGSSVYCLVNRLGILQKQTNGEGGLSNHTEVTAVLINKRHISILLSRVAGKLSLLLKYIKQSIKWMLCVTY